MGKKSRFGSGMNIPDHISESLETIFWAKILEFFDTDADPGIFLTLDPGSRMEKNRTRGRVFQCFANLTNRYDFVFLLSARKCSLYL
jgi:hypothetical protein